MAHGHRPESRHGGWILSSVALLGLLLALGVACATTGREGTPVQGWWAGRGPVIPHEKFPADCSLCHEGKGWDRIRADFIFDHAKETGVALEGAHRAAECLRCHNDRGPVEMFAARGCGGCHEDPHRSQMGPSCESCHEQASWRPSELIATHARTRFPLVGAHAAAACWQCHPGAQVGNFARADTSCESCHAQDLARATSPDHVAQGWTSDCQRCHMPVAWDGAAFSHGFWPLSGAHASASCSDCHAGNVYAGTPNQCVDCHQLDYDTAADPDHVTPSFTFPTTCRQCHSTSSWQGASFSHAGITSSCVSCHLPDYQGATSPNHVTYNFPQSCEQCHATSSWTVSNFSHAGISSGCSNCHMADYASTTSPNHAQAGFGTSCESCHTSTNNWGQDNWSHPDFPIQTGRHAGIACATCHTQPGNFSSFNCTNCHAHRQSEMNSEHEDVGGYVFGPQTCYQCHPNGNG